MITPAFDVKDFMENLLFDRHREAYQTMSEDQKAVVRFAFIRGYLTEQSEKEST
jgi:hypothetical protein